MRIITGKFKGRKIQLPNGLEARPTTDFAKTGLFNILENYMDWENMSALDLFAGSGNITLELISRGARFVTFVDQSSSSISFINSCAEKFEMNNLKGIRSDVMRFIQTDGGRYDFIFSDPPYQWNHSGEAIQSILDQNMLKPNGWLVWEHGSKENFSAIEGFFDHRKYGNVNFSFFKKS
jgi:16S rRNA (guanine(966)-N(2))-methyltransferase RsmD